VEESTYLSPLILRDWSFVFYPNSPQSVIPIGYIFGLMRSLQGLISSIIPKDLLPPPFLEAFPINRRTFATPCFAVYAKAFSIP
jgi:hypothetical protein